MPFSEKVSARVGFGEVLQHTPLACILTNELLGDMQPSLVAGGIKVALLTTVFGLVVAIILQVFYNYIIAKIDSIVNNMEDSSISLMDILVKNKK